MCGSASRRPCKAGQWAPVGGMWVESDGNLPGGEAAGPPVHPRQAVLPRGVRHRDQGRVAAGLLRLQRRLSRSSPSWPAASWFLTQKISWNQTNKFPHHTFWWEGIDGTRRSSPTSRRSTPTTRCFTGEEMARAVRNYAEQGRRHPLARAVRLRRRRWRPHPRDDGDGRAGSPTWRVRREVVVEHPDEFFAAARAEYPDAPVWSGELYLELHRATYTSPGPHQAGQPPQRAPAARGRAVGDHGRAARAGLRLPVREAGPAVEDGAAAPVPRHPAGRSIAWVHREAEAEYAAVAAELRSISTAALVGVGRAAADGAGSSTPALAPSRSRAVPRAWPPTVRAVRRHGAVLTAATAPAPAAGPR